MAVFTSITDAQAHEILKNYSVGDFISLEGISAGIENTNYFLTTTTNKYILTVFEILNHEQLPFYIKLMHHLASHGLAVPMPQKQNTQELIGTFDHKPMTIVSCLQGQYEPNPNQSHCELAAKLQAEIHLQAKDYSIQQANLRGLSWWLKIYPKIKKHLSSEQNSLYKKALDEQIKYQATEAWKNLPEGPCHCDLFRDNALFYMQDNQLKLGGVIDFYFAGVDKWLFDIAVAINDWCIYPDTGAFKMDLADTWLKAYASERSFTQHEKDLWPIALRAAALRFWTSRLHDFYYPREAVSLTPHDPTHFERILKQRFEQPIPNLPE